MRRAVDGSSLCGGHAFEHLELELRRIGKTVPDDQCPRDVEQVVAGQPDADRVGPLRTQRRFQQPLVAGIDIGLRRIGRLVPAVHLGIDALHRQVRALDQTNLDPTTLALMSSERPLTELLERFVGLREVGLQDDPSIHLLELQFVQNRRECGHRQRQILEFLHVEVDELRRLG